MGKEDRPPSLFERARQVVSNLTTGAASRVEAWSDDFAKARQPSPSSPSSPSSPLPTPYSDAVMLDQARLYAAVPGLSDYPVANDPEGIFWDPFSVVEQLGYKDKPSAINFATLDAMFWRLPILGAIRQRRLNQIAEFCVPQRSPQESGFEIVPRDKYMNLSPAARRWIGGMTDRVLTTGYVKDDRRERAGFEHFVRSLMRDSLTYDAAAFQVIPDRVGRPSQWYAMDAATIRLADTSKLAPSDSMNAVQTVQVYDNVVVAEFARGELCYGIRNPSTAIRAQGYGMSEAELCISTITHLLWSLNHNANYFRQGLGAKGLLNIVGSIPTKQLSAFRRHFYQMVMGEQNAFRVPVTNAEKLEWIKLQDSNKDMEYSQWIDFLIKICCSCMSIDPVEVGFKYGNQGQRSSAMVESNQRAKVLESKQQGLTPLLRSLSRWINEYIIWPTDPDFEFRFVGFSTMTPKEIADLETMEVRTHLTVNEVRARKGLPPNADGDVILDPNFLQARRDRLLLVATNQSEVLDETRAENDAAREQAAIVTALTTLGETANPVQPEQATNIPVAPVPLAGTGEVVGDGDVAKSRDPMYDLDDLIEFEI